MSKILTVLAQRLALGILTLLVVSVMIFLSLNLVPGDIATEILGQSATPETLAAMRNQLNLDQPLPVQYFVWLGDALQGNLGQSLATGRDVSSLIGQRLLNTLYLASITAAVAIPLSIILGVLAALYRNSIFDRVSSAAVLSAISMPEFFIAYLLIFFFSINLGWLPSLADISADMSFSDRLVKLALPVASLTLMISAHMMRMTRASILNILSRPFIEMATLKGLSSSRIVFHHALPNAWAPIVNVIAINLAYLISGVVVIEVVFVYPGLGQLMVDSVSKRDIPVVQACSVIFAATYVLLNLCADIVSTTSDPRILHSK